jgi:hypothetical protein
MDDLGQLLDLARRLRLQACETRLPNYAIRFRQAATELEAFVAANRQARHADREADGRALTLPACLARSGS